MNDLNKHNIESDEDYTSKSELKRQMHQLQLLGESLITLPNKKLKALSINEELYEAIITAKEMKNDNGRRRQLQRIGKLMRSENAEQIESELNTSYKEEQQQKAAKKQQEANLLQIYEKLTKGSNNDLAELIEQYPHANRQRLRQLINNVKKEIKPTDKQVAVDKKPSRNVKRLMEEIQTLLENTN